MTENPAEGMDGRTVDDAGNLLIPVMWYKEVKIFLPEFSSS